MIRTGDALFLVIWFAGIVVSSGFWQTFLACFPPYGFYLGVEKLLEILTKLT